MAWTVLCSNVLLQQTPGTNGQFVNAACCYAVAFDESGNPVQDNNGRSFTLIGATPLVSTYRQPSDFWSLIEADLETRLSAHSGYVSATFYRVDVA